MNQPLKASTALRPGGRARVLVLVCLVVLLVVTVVARRPLLRSAGGFWVVEDDLAPADALIVLSDDNYGSDRAARAAELYHQHYAPVVVASGRMLRPYFGIGDLMTRDLSARGVPALALLVEPHTAADTLEEAQVMRGLVAAHGWRRIIVVTSNYHTRRARYIYRRVMPSGVSVSVAAANDSQYDASSWWQSRAAIKIFMHEFAGMLEGLWELRHHSSRVLSQESKPDGAASVWERGRLAAASGGPQLLSPCCGAAGV
jgi:uncharacterized SAM-binding protein YcdF (DUF218 family)